MGTQFSASAIQSVARQGIEAVASAQLAGDCVHSIARQGATLRAKAGLSSAAPDREMFSYKNLGRPVVRTHYHIELRDSSERLKFADDFENLVTSAGLDKLLDAAFLTGLQTPAWFIGLVNGTPTPAYVVGDVMASHVGWVEFLDYVEVTRPALVPGAISGGSLDNVASRAVFNMSDVGAVAGCFLVDDDEPDGVDGVLYGVGAFTGGSRDVEDGDILRVAATLTITAE